VYIYGKRIEKALEVYEKSLPTNHSLLAVIHYNISEVYNGLHQHEKAIGHAKKKTIHIANYSSVHDSVQLQIYKDFLDELGERL